MPTLKQIEIKMIISDSKIIIKEAQNLSIKAYLPYWGMNNFFVRQCRKALCRFRFLQKIFYNRKIKKDNDDTVIIFDSLITREYLKWVEELFPDKKLIFWYWNPIRKTLPLKDIPSKFSVWTYSLNEALENHISFHEQFFIGDDFEPTKDLGYVLFIGKDKGRSEQIFKYEQILNNAHIKTRFFVVSDKRRLFIKNSKLLNSPLKYEYVQQLARECHVILDYCTIETDGLSLRPLEALKYNKLLVTNNKSIEKAKFYNNNQVFLLQEGNYNELLKFCSCNKKVIYGDKSKFSFGTWYRDLCEGVKD